MTLLHCDIAPHHALPIDPETTVTPDMTIGTPRRWLKPLCLAGAFLFLLTALSLMTSQRANAQFGGRVWLSHMSAMRFANASSPCKRRYHNN